MAKHGTTTVLDRDDEGAHAGAVEKQDVKKALLPLILVVLGLLVLLYPVVASQWNNVKQLRAADEYSKLEEAIPEDKLNERLESAKRYNEGRTEGPILDPWLSRVSEDNAPYKQYLDELDQQEAMGRIVVPAAKADLPIYHGTSDQVLQKGVGHLFGSDLPVGGEDTHAVLTGHTGLANATLFDNLVDVREGDPIYVAAAGQKIKYEVHDIRVVLPNEAEGLGVHPGEDLLTLITCTPYGINSHRLVVTAHRVEMDAADEKAFEESGLTWQWWMWVILAFAGAIVIGLLWWLRKLLRAAKAAEASAAAAIGAGESNAENNGESYGATTGAGYGSDDHWADADFDSRDRDNGGESHNQEDRR